MKNTKTLHQAAAAKLELLEHGFDKLFKDAGNCDNKTWRENYKSRYDAMDRMLDKAYRVFWYTSPDIPRHNKQINHRATIAPMRAAGLHRMAIN